MRRLAALSLFVLAVAPAIARGIDVDPSLTLDATAAHATRAEITPIVWWSAFAGDVNTGGADAFDLEAIDADEPAVAVGAEARIDARRLVFTLGGFHRSDSSGRSAIEPFTAGALTVNAGDRVDWDLDITVFKGTVGYRFEPAIDTDRVRLAFDAYAGLRFTDIELVLAAPAGEASFDESWALPLVGARMRLDLPHGFDVLIESDIGYLPLGDTSAFGWEVFAGVGYHPAPNVGLRVGFRHLSINYLDESGPGDTEFNGFLAGLYVGAVIRF